MNVIDSPAAEVQNQTGLSAETLIKVAHEYGSPVYVYHAETIRDQYKKLTQAFKSAPAVFFYACKALTNINILKYVRSIGSNIDCSSVNEVQLAIKAGFEPANILYTSNNIAFSEIEQAHRHWCQYQYRQRFQSQEIRTKVRSFISGRVYD